ncbi:hypothetical protein CHGG_00164 [Chaetomium globosum CBS 148.51]|uniref:NACHT domain-containing protein n=1 Tax=Chaetomium globosum (strain ATCC 6205 / CBS 148.51 / DSM 1962 / NBRC 6347 / NRRL 1970) TaxID=306901 RepID=Q2HHZ0_CHAGB|nr:uncharacterized protein CHGG_00164 [Chaetomium globosum CBS 148.51]EAQ91929.1 hypothetical protein CHGG_00164 [Chaetomium globosum CBS 148.51]
MADKTMAVRGRSGAGKKTVVGSLLYKGLESRTDGQYRDVPGYFDQNGIVKSFYAPSAKIVVDGEDYLHSTSAPDIVLWVVDVSSPDRGAASSADLASIICSGALKPKDKLLILLNKMDLVDWSEESFVEVAMSFKDIQPDSTITDIVPASTLTGDNILEPPQVRWLELCGVTGALSVQKQLAPLHTQKRGSGGLARAAEAAPARGWGTGVAGLCSLISQSTNRPACAEWLHNGLGPEHLLSWHKPMTIQGPAPSHHARADIPLNLLIVQIPSQHTAASARAVSDTLAAMKKLLGKLTKGRSRPASAGASRASLPDSGIPLERLGLIKLADTTPGPDGGEQYPVDIVAVHGLNGDSYTTWTHQNGLGGIVCKQALVIAHEDNSDPTNQRLLQSMAGIVFFGTPHRGSDTAKLGNLVGTMINTFLKAASAGLQTKTIRTDLLRHLESDSKALQELADSVRDRLGSLQIVSFYETEPESSWPSCEKYGAWRKLHRVYPIGQAHILPKQMRIPTPAKGTCQWILGHPLFVSWLEKAENALLWLTGHPGCGKTILSFFLAKQLETPRESRTPPGNVCIYFCDDKISKQKVANNILIGLIFQLVRRHRSLARHVRKVYQMHGQNIVRSFTALWGLFRDIATDPRSGPTIIIIDALDECEEDTRRSLLKAIKGFIQDLERPNAGGQHVKFVLTSRPLEDVERMIDRVSDLRIRIDDYRGGPDGDIQIYIRQRLDEISEQLQFDPKLRQSLQELLYSKSGQTFLWVHMVLTALETVPRMSTNYLKVFVQQIPSDLEMTYVLLVSRIHETHLEAASKLLKLILGSSRPLHLDEINIAFSIATNHRTAKDVKEDCQTGMHRTLNTILGQLVRISDSQVSLVHQSAKEFILQETGRNQKLPGPIRTIRKEDCALEMATACIGYLLLDDFAEDSFSLVESPTKSPSDTSNTGWEDEDEEGYAHDMFKEPSILDEDTCRLLASEHPFYEYAALHWTEHFVLCEASAPQSLRDAAKKLLDTSTTHCTNWLRFHSTEAIAGDQSTPQSAEPVTLAALFNFHETLRDYLGGDVPPQQAHLDTALFWGAEQGHDRIVDTLLRAGADPNARVSGKQTALIVAAKNGHSDCVRTLLADKCTDLNLAGERGRTALSFACHGGHDEVVKTLLSREDCAVDDADESGSTALIWAAGSGRPETVALLLAQHPRVDVNHRDKAGRTAVSWAAGDGMEEVLKTLLRLKWIDPNLKDNEGRSPLSWAAGHGCVAALRVLLRNNRVDKASVDNKLKSPITWACERAQADSLRMLLSHGCPGVDEGDESGWTPLAWAIHNASPATVELLVSNPAVDIERRDMGGRTPLSWAVSYGHLKAVKVLLRAGADPRTESDTGLTPISAAETLGRADIIEELRYYISEEPSVSISFTSKGS